MIVAFGFVCLLTLAFLVGLLLGRRELARSTPSSLPRPSTQRRGVDRGGSRVPQSMSSAGTPTSHVRKVDRREHDPKGSTTCMDCGGPKDRRRLVCDRCGLRLRAITERQAAHDRAHDRAAR